jgi:hypothetical protein
MGEGDRVCRHQGGMTSGGLGPTLRRQVDSRQRPPRRPGWLPARADSGRQPLPGTPAIGVKFFREQLREGANREHWRKLQEQGRDLGDSIGNPTAPRSFNQGRAASPSDQDKRIKPSASPISASCGRRGHAPSRKAEGKCAILSVAADNINCAVPKALR